MNPADLGPGSRAEQVARRALEDHQYEAAFLEMLTTFLIDGPSKETAVASAVLCAMCSGVMLLAEAASMAVALKSAMLVADSVYLYFAGVSGRLRCAKLNPIALCVRDGLVAMSFTQQDALKSFLDWLDHKGPTLLRASPGDRAMQIEAVQRGAERFWSKCLPRVLANDAKGELTLRPLRPQALARRGSGQPLVRGANLAPSVFAAGACLFTGSTVNQRGSVMEMVVTIMATGDGTNLAALRAQQLTQLEPLLEEVDGDDTSLLLVLIAAGFCEHGTVQTDRPSHSITSRYIRELGQMFGSDWALAGSLPSLEPTQRRVAYETLLNHAYDRSDANAALSNVDMHICTAFGCEPVGVLRGGQDSRPLRRSRYLSPAEVQRVLQATKACAPTPDLQVVVDALASIAGTRPVRPGDMRDATFEDLEVKANRVVLNRRRRSNRKGPKTATAEGPIEFTDPEVCRVLKELKDFRARQAAMDSDPLWARDLESSRWLYARACGLLDLACKHVTGDSFESFYSLRHARISADVFQALMLDDSKQAQVALKQASVRADHRNVSTTMEEYFHLGPEVLHKHVMRRLGGLLTSKVAAKWSGVAVNTLDQRVARNQADKAVVYWAAISAATLGAALKPITAEFPCAPSASRMPTELLKLDDVLSSSVCDQLEIKDGQPTWASDAARCVNLTDWGQRMVRARTKYGRQWPHRLRLAAARQDKLRPLARQLRRFANREPVRKATILWRASVRDGFLDVSKPQWLSGWVSFLTHCGLPASRLVLRVEPGAVPNLGALSSTFALISGLMPTVDLVSPGKGRPAAYLLISSQDVRAGEIVPSAATNMAGFHALMLAACMREDLLNPDISEAHDGKK